MAPSEGVCDCSEHAARRSTQSIEIAGVILMEGVRGRLRRRLNPGSDGREGGEQARHSISISLADLPCGIMGRTCSV